VTDDVKLVQVICPQCGEMDGWTEKEDYKPMICWRCRQKQHQAVLSVLRWQMPGVLFVVQDDEYGYMFITDCPNPHRIKELAREASIKYREERDDEVTWYVRGRFELAGYKCESLWDVVSMDMRFDVEDD
jgi:hypothetical protein